LEVEPPGRERDGDEDAEDEIRGRALDSDGGEYKDAEHDGGGGAGKGERGGVEQHHDKANDERHRQRVATENDAEREEDRDQRRAAGGENHQPRRVGPTAYGARVSGLQPASP